MTGPVRMALAFVSLSFYFFVLGLWQRGKTPRVVSGTLDYALLSMGLGAFLVLGPVGELVVNWMFPRPNVWAWLSATAAVGLVVLSGTAKVKTRIVIYHVDAAALEAAVMHTMTMTIPPITRTVLGFENEERHCGVSLHLSSYSGTGIVEAHGDHPERLIEAVLPILRRELRHANSPSWLMATIMFGSSAVMLIIAMVSWGNFGSLWLRRLTG